jgi:hypothetical protein
MFQAFLKVSHMDIPLNSSNETTMKIAFNPLAIPRIELTLGFTT